MDRKTLIFIEVKTRTNPNAGHPEEAVNQKKLNNLQKAAQFFLIQNPQYENFALRIDVIAIENGEIKHYEAVY